MVVVGAGRIGTALSVGGAATSVVTRDAGWEALDRPPGEPIVLTVRNDDLDAVLARVPETRRPDLVFVQNGALRTFLADRGLAEATRAVLYVLVDHPGPPAITRTSFATGPHADAVATDFGRAGLPTQAVDRATFGVHEIEKLVWLAANGVLCQALAVPVGQVAELAPEALEELTAELGIVVARAWNMDAPMTLLAQGLAWSDAIPEYRAGVKEWGWRNGWIQQEARRLGIETPHHERWLVSAGIGHRASGSGQRGGQGQGQGQG